MPYLGNVPAEAYTNTVKDSFNGDASTTAFTLSQPSTTNNLRVVVENVIQDPTVAYTVSGTTLTFTSAPPVGTANIYAVHLGPATQTAVPPSEINNATTYTSDLTVQGDLTVDTNTLYVDSTNNRVGVGTASPTATLESLGGQLRIGASTAGSMFLVNPSTTYSDGVDLQATYNGAGSYGPLKFSTGGSERLRIDSSGRVTTPYQPAFIAYEAPTSYSAGGTIVWQYTLLNRGSAYSNTTGRYTAPVAGLYQFGTSIRIESSEQNLNYHRVVFFKNGTALQHSQSRLDFHIQGSYSHSANDMLIELSANDFVQVQFQANVNGPFTTGARSEHTFYGYLVG